MAPSRKICVEFTAKDQATILGQRAYTWSTTHGSTVYMTGRLQSDLARAQALGIQCFNALGGPAVDEAVEACKKLCKELHSFYRDRSQYGDAFTLQPPDHPVRVLDAEHGKLFVGPLYLNYRAGQRFADPRLNWPDKNAILIAASRFIQATEAQVEAEFQDLLAAAADWTARVRAYMDPILAEEKVERLAHEQRLLDGYTQNARDIRERLRLGEPIPGYSLQPLRKHKLLTEEEIATVEAVWQAERRAYWFDLYHKGELPEGVVPYTPDWERWLDSRDYYRWDNAMQVRDVVADAKAYDDHRDDLAGHSVWHLQERLVRAHDKRLDQRFKRFGKNCRSRNR